MKGCQSWTCSVHRLPSPVPGSAVTPTIGAVSARSRLQPGDELKDDPDNSCSCLLMPRCLGCAVCSHDEEQNVIMCEPQYSRVNLCQLKATSSKSFFLLLIKLQNHLKALHSKDLFTSTPLHIDHKRGCESRRGKKGRWSPFNFARHDLITNSDN